jgi:hypothetical protein
MIKRITWNLFYGHEKQFNDQELSNNEREHEKRVCLINLNADHIEYTCI